MNDYNRKKIQKKRFALFSLRLTNQYLCDQDAHIKSKKLFWDIDQYFLKY